MEIALTLAWKYDFTAVAIRKRKHFRPPAPFKYTPVVRRRSYVLADQIVRVFSWGSTRMDDSHAADDTNVSPLPAAKEMGCREFW